jgi:hypothetical protein
VEEVFMSLEDEEEGATNRGSNATSTAPPASPQQTEYVIHGSPLWLISGIALFGVMIVSSSDWSWWLTLVALVLPVYGFFEYTKTVIVSWNQEQRHVEVFEGARYSGERWLVFAYTSEPGDEINIESVIIGKLTPDLLDIFSNRDYWLEVKRKDGTLVASSKDTENSHYFAKRIKNCLDLF